MSKYGEIINPNFDPRKDYVYDMLANYFGNPLLTLIKPFVYAVEIESHMANTKRYLFVTAIDKLGYTEPLDKIKWSSLQTRTIEEKYDVGKHSYVPKNKHPFNSVINVSDRKTDYVTYRCPEIPQIVITLLICQQPKQARYNDTGTVASALQTFQTIVTFV